jgi:hypothetical protein
VSSICENHHYGSANMVAEKEKERKKKKKLAEIICWGTML